jgi:methyl-accepting chemotaxis protein
MAIYQAGALGGKIVQAVRDAIKAVLAYFGVNPSSSALVSELKKIAQYIKDKVKYIKEITDALNGFIAYVNAIKQILAYILSLPAVLLTYFKDCIATLKKQLVSGFQSALDNTPDPNQAAIDDLKNTIKDVQGSIGQFTSAVGTLAATAALAAGSLLTPGQVSIANTQQQAAATQEVFSAAGYSPSTGFSKP